MGRRPARPRSPPLAPRNGSARDTPRQKRDGVRCSGILRRRARWGWGHHATSRDCAHRPCRCVDRVDRRLHGPRRHQPDHRDLVCTFAPSVITNRVASVTVTAPDEVSAGSTFDVDFLVEIDLPAVSPLSIFDFSVRSQWTIDGGATPSGPLSLATAGADYPLGSSIVYETLTQSFTATGSPGDCDRVPLRGCRLCLHLHRRRRVGHRRLRVRRPTRRPGLDADHLGPREPAAASR